MTVSTPRILQVLAFALASVALALGVRDVFFDASGSGLLGAPFVLGSLVVTRVRRRHLRAGNFRSAPQESK
jgi:hypothetical protein